MIIRENKIIDQFPTPKHQQIWLPFWKLLAFTVIITAQWFLQDEAKLPANRSALFSIFINVIILKVINTIFELFHLRSVMTYMFTACLDYKHCFESCRKICQPASRAFLSLHYGVLVHGSRKVFVEHVLIVAGVQFRNRPNSRAFSTAGSVMADLSKNRYSHSKNQFDERKQDWLVVNDFSATSKVRCGSGRASN